MCGIIGYVSLKPTNKHSTFLGQGLIVDSLRGVCGTGIYGFNIKNKESFVWKRALSGPDFVHTLQFGQYQTHAHALNLVIGHNRASTIGQAKDPNCHPFIYDHIALVHNGTLRNYLSLFNTGEFNHSVDSAYAAKAISVYGDVEALEKIDGAFVFVWHDAVKNTFNIARNGMRDIWYITDKDGENLYYASEYEMLEWLLDRNDIARAGKYRSPAEYTLCSWDLGAKTLHRPKLTPFEEYKPPKPTYPVYQGNQGGYWGGTYGDYRKNRDEEDLAKIGIEQFEYLEVVEHKYELYTSSQDKGKMEGKVKVSLKKEETILNFRYHGLDKTVYDAIKDKAPLYICANSVWYDNQVPVIISRGLRSSQKEEENLPVKQDLFQGPEGRWFDKEAFIKLTATGCCYCADPISPDDSKSLRWFKIGMSHEPLCGKCASDASVLDDMEHYQNSGVLYNAAYYD